MIGLTMRQLKFLNKLNKLYIIKQKQTNYENI